MAGKAPKWCAGCKVVHGAGQQCPKRVAFGRKAAGDSSGRGGAKWRKVREVIFRRDGFMCQICLANGVVTPVELHGPKHGVCDHVVAIADGGEDAESNLQTICQGCDKTKTQREAQAGRGRVKVQGFDL